MIEIKKHFNDVSDKWEKLEKNSIWYNWSEMRQIHMMKNLPGSKILDVGTGIGTMAIQAFLHGARNVEGIDVSDDMVSIAKKIASHASCEQDVTFQRMDAKSMSFANETFDIVICSAVAEIEPEFHLVLAEIQRVLKPGGVLYLLLIPNTPFNRIWTTAMMLINKKPEWKLRYKYLRTERDLDSIIPEYMRIINKHYFGYTIFNPIFAFSSVKKLILPLALDYVEPVIESIFSPSIAFQRFFSHSAFLTIKKQIS